MWWKLFQIAVICAVLAPIIKWRGESDLGGFEIFFYVVGAILVAIGTTKLLGALSDAIYGRRKPESDIPA